MSRPVVARKYGKKSTRTKAERLFSELPQTPVRKQQSPDHGKDEIEEITHQISDIKIDGEKALRRSPRKSTKVEPVSADTKVEIENGRVTSGKTDEFEAANSRELDLEEITKPVGLEEPEEPDIGNVCLEEHVEPQIDLDGVERDEQDEPSFLDDNDLHHMTWDELCPFGNQIVKIAEASYAEVYRITNDQGTSIIKVIRLESPIRPKTKAQIKAGLIDEEPRSEVDTQGELQISELLAGVPGFVIYKERYVVQGKATKHLLETHQTFQRRMKRQDPGRAQFYPSPSRYLDETKFLVVELGDAGSALEDWKVETESQLWDIFFLEALALARAEIEAHFEVKFPFPHHHN